MHVVFICLLYRPFAQVLPDPTLTQATACVDFGFPYQRALEVFQALACPSISAAIPTRKTTSERAVGGKET